jgi:hypothetical protein
MAPKKAKKAPPPPRAVSTRRTRASAAAPDPPPNATGPIPPPRNATVPNSTAPNATTASAVQADTEDKHKNIGSDAITVTDQQNVVVLCNVEVSDILCSVVSFLWYY